MALPDLVIIPSRCWCCQRQNHDRCCTKCYESLHVLTLRLPPRPVGLCRLVVMLRAKFLNRKHVSDDLPRLRAGTLMACVSMEECGSTFRTPRCGSSTSLSWLSPRTGTVSASNGCPYSKVSRPRRWLPSFRSLRPRTEGGFFTQCSASCTSRISIRRPVPLLLRPWRPQSVILPSW